MTYGVIYESGDGAGWSAYVPDLPGAAAAGRTLDEVRRLMPGTIALHIRGLREDGLAVPPPTNMILEPVTVPVD